MSWIEEIETDDADGELAKIYAELIEKRGKVANILKVHSLNPAAMSNHLDLYMTIMFGKSGLSRAEREAIAVVVSASNDCAYCVNHHVEALRRYIKDEETLKRMKEAGCFEIEYGIESGDPETLRKVAKHITNSYWVNIKNY